MLVNLTDVFTTEGLNKIEQTIFESDVVHVLGLSYPLLDKEPVLLNLVNTGMNKALIHVTTSFSVNMKCDRCLRDVVHRFSLEFDVNLVSPDYSGVEIDEDFETPEYLEEYNLNVDDMIYSEMILNWPMKILCRSDCKGICNVCGKDLNEGECGCDTFIPNPALAGIKEIFNANKEV